MRFAYADPPYLGMGRKMYADHPEHAVWDAPEGHHDLVARLVAEFPDGWAMSASSASLPSLMRGVPEKVRTAAWVKPWASFRPNVAPAYAWEPVLFMGGRKRTRTEWTGRDWLSCGITHGRSVRGAKPDAFCFWVFEDLFNARPGDELVDLFPGSGAVGRAWEAWCGLRGGLADPSSIPAATAEEPQREIAFDKGRDAEAGAP